MSAAPTLAIGIATAGRRAQMHLTLAQLARQRSAPTRILVCPAGPDDYDETSAAPLRCPVEVLRGPRGLTAQRNTILAACQGIDILLFIDDDFYPDADYVEQLRDLFERHPDIVVATNHPVRDGATGPGIAHEQAVAVIAALQPLREGEAALRTTYGGYGCNMAVRVAVAHAHGLRFDENLPLYGWLEDVDFSRRMAPYGRLVEYKALRGVHLGSKGGRVSGLRFGYSQVANPIYLLRKGSMSMSYALRQLGRNLAKNLAGSLWSEPWVDRRGRLRGNLLAFGDLLRGRLDPRRIQQLP